MKIVITGANGQLGSELSEILTNDNKVSVVFLDRALLPLSDLSQIPEVLQKYNPELIIHAAAYTAVDRAESDQENANIVNHLASAQIAKFCAENNVKLIAISTDYVFDGSSTLPLSEEAEVDPINVYGKTKFDGEKAMQKYNPSSIIVRTSWVYSIYGSNFVKTMLKLMDERDEISVVSDQIGSPTYARDLAQVIIKIAIADVWKPGIYHYSNEGKCSWYEFASMIRDLSKSVCRILPVHSNEFPTAARRPNYSLLDKTKIKDTFDIEIPNWENSLGDMLTKQKSRIS
ncbi:dTDP-4-dehydrorhamnose reductase [Sphingobacterium chungjuense]|uniref:dTDP-4-dehydrorhamnose reductase n=1 Tax=Sphingobacterium chungjuense TaxID=2675553 RepID=UPI00140DFE7E|nr:dTDP-4-dehydrorhamnose reductase [Sphingobacterium chungjuense]